MSLWGAEGIFVFGKVIFIQLDHTTLGITYIYRNLSDPLKDKDMLEITRRNSL